MLGFSDAGNYIQCFYLCKTTANREKEQGQSIGKRACLEAIPVQCVEVKYRRSTTGCLSTKPSARYRNEVTQRKAPMYMELPRIYFYGNMKGVSHGSFLDSGSLSFKNLQSKTASVEADFL